MSLMAWLRPVAVAACVLAWAASIGCYSYHPAAEAPAPNQRVRIVLTQEGTTELARFLGPRVTVAEGTLVERRADGASIVAVDWVQGQDGTRQSWSGEGVVAFPVALVERMDQRRLSRSRSVLVTIAVVAAVVGIAFAALRNAAAEGGPGPGTGAPPT